ncbi:MAG: TonB-dependent receptor [Bacteroidales bacterium]|nr:TonB-dependent receptor [Bacteroidales bacterium]MCF8456863.1 TonB-dependent receptor [Bacteroidales bacterium]
MKKRIIFIACLFLSVAAMAQNIQVIDKVSLQAIPEVFIFSPDTSAITNAKGKAGSKGFEGAETIQFHHPSYQKVTVSYAKLKEAKFKILMTESPILLNEVVVSASGREQSKSKVPNKIATITANQISLQNPQTAADLVGNAGGVFIQKSQYGGGSPMIRGFAANRVLIAVDGVRMNNAIFRSGNLQNVISIDPFSISKTEVIFGAGSVIYGSDAVGGVMNFYTHRPTLSTGDKAFVKVNTAIRYATASKEKTGHVDFNLGFNKWAFVTSATFSDFGDLKMGSRGPDEYLRPEYVERINGKDSVLMNSDPQIQNPTGYSQINLMQKIRFRPNTNWDINFASHYSTTSNYSRYDRLIRYKNGLPRSAEWYYGPQVWTMNNLKIDQIADTKMYDKLSIGLAHQYFEESRHDRDFQKTERYHRYENVKVISANIDFEKALNEKQKFYYGAEALLNKVGSTGEDEDISTGSMVPASSRYPDGSTWNSYAAYLSWWNTVNDQLSVQAGLRYNQITLASEFDATYYDFPFTSADLNKGALTGSLGFNYKASENWLLKLNLSTAFRAPNIDDIGKVFDSGDGQVVVPNPDLKPEYAYNAELGITRTFGEKVEIDFSVFYILLDQAMVRRDYTLNGLDSIIYDGELSQVQAIQNAAQASVYGFQADVEAILPMGFGFTTHFSYQKGEEELDDGSTAPLRHAAPMFGSSHLTYTRNRFKADFYAVYNGEIANKNLAPSEIEKAYIYARDADGNPYCPSWHTINLKLRYQLNKHIMLSLGAENLTDQRYRPYSSGVAASGRNFIFSVKGTF